MDHTVILLKVIPLELGEGLGADVGEALGASVPAGPIWKTVINSHQFHGNFLDDKILKYGH